MLYKDYYQLLGVQRDVTVDALKKAFRKLARKYHPDVSKEADAEARMREINEAYAVLSDPEKRAAYDNSDKAINLAKISARHPIGTRDSSFLGRNTPLTKRQISAIFSLRCLAAWADTREAVAVAPLRAGVAKTIMRRCSWI